MLQNRSRGVTLIELLAFILLASIFAIVFLPSSNVSTVPFESAVEKLKYDIRYAQWMAINRKSVYGLVFDPNGEQYSVFLNSSANIIPDPLNPGNSFTVDYTTDSKFTGVDLNSVDINGTNQVKFNGGGFPLDANNVLLPAVGTIVLLYGENQATISIEPNTGAVSRN